MAHPLCIKINQNIKLLFCLSCKLEYFCKYMKHYPDEITSSKLYRHILTLSYNEIIPFVFHYLKKRTFPLVLYLFLLAISFTWFIIKCFVVSTSHTFLQLGLHIVIGFVIIPVLIVIPHEILHIIPYFISGARRIKVGAEWKNFYFYVTADKFPVSRPVFIVIVLTPLIIVTSSFCLLTFSSSELWQLTFIASLFVHLTMSAGDIALLNFYYIHRRKKIITWDDVASKEAYFYEYGQLPGTE